MTLSSASPSHRRTVIIVCSSQGTGKRFLRAGALSKRMSQKPSGMHPFLIAARLWPTAFPGAPTAARHSSSPPNAAPGVSLDMVDLAHTNGKVKFTDADGAQGKVIKVHDWQFAYYGPEDSQIQLSFADSPAMTRLLVFDNGHWRPDRIGEFSRFYSRLLRETMHKARVNARKGDPELSRLPGDQGCLLQSDERQTR